MSEAEWKTRKERIDKRLRSLTPPWQIIKWRDDLQLDALTCHAVEEFPTANGPADYALFVGGQLLGIIEGKKVAVNPQNVLEQAKRYAAGAFNGVGDWRGLKVPFLYSTNGEVIWFLDTRTEKLRSRRIAHFHTPAALQTAFNRAADVGHKWFTDTPIIKVERLRPYQLEAINSIERTVSDGRRELLVAMATGTGKTYTTVAQIYRLLESGFAKRILFLVDRKALAAQAVREFSAFNTPKGNKFINDYEVYSQRFRREDFGEDEPFDSKVLPNEYLTNPKSSQTFVYVSTIQRMAINLFGHEHAFPQTVDEAEREEEADKLDIPIHAFDLIIADECHRGYTAQETSVWRETINHFDAIKVGLTATPAAHTVALFGEPVFRYGVEQAIREGYLVDYEPVAINSNVKMNGVFLKEGEQVERVDLEKGTTTLDQLEDERAFTSESIEREITAPKSNRRIIEEIKKYAQEHETATGRFPKTLIFAVNDISHKSHADQLVSICRDVFNQGDDFVQKITGNANVDRPLQRIREFRNRPKPKIAVTVDMLSTGVDIPALEFIVFLRPVKSRILWEQMLGRGTRKWDNPTEGNVPKSKFVVFDCFDGTLIRYFKDASNFAIEPPRAKPLTIPEVIDNIWQNIERDYHINVLVKRLRRIDKEMSGEARTLFGRWIPNGDMGAFAGTLVTALSRDFTGTMKLLRDPDFQNALLNFPRPRAIFLISHETDDTVSSQKLERYGKYDNAQDYLDAFTAFVRNNANKIAALRVLTQCPKDWKPEVLEELKRTLTQHDYPVEKLRAAHKRIYNAAADVISMVKHAAKIEEPLFTPEERVNRAMDKILSRHSFSLEQKKFLSLIREHLVTNLTISEDDFDDQPLLRGKAKARLVFGNDFETIISELNFAVAA